MCPDRFFSRIATPPDVRAPANQRSDLPRQKRPDKWADMPRSASLDRTGSAVCPGIQSNSCFPLIRDAGPRTKQFGFLQFGGDEILWALCVPASWSFKGRICDPVRLFLSDFFK